MKRPGLFTLLIVVSFLLQRGTVTAQLPCQPDPQFTSPGIYPSDTLRDMFQNQQVHEDLTIVVPEDTVLFGLTVPIDSFKTTLISNNAALGLSWTCQASTYWNCTYPAPGFGGWGYGTCGRVSGTVTTSNPAFPGYDSLVIQLEMYYTVPFVGRVVLTQLIPVYFRMFTGDANVPAIAADGLSIAPVPADQFARARYELSEASTVRLSVLDVLGREIAVLAEGTQEAGDHEFSVGTADLAPGTYVLRLQEASTGAVNAQRFVVMH